MGVTKVPLVGGRYDGEVWVAVVGCPVCVPIKPTPQKSQEREGADLISVFAWGSQPVEGEEWKNAAKAKELRPEQRSREFALYAPRIENGKASLALYFVEEVSL
jgi:hypothetical protein